MKPDPGLLDALPQGFELRMFGTSGFLCFRRDDRMLMTRVEPTGAGQRELLVWTDGLAGWALPAPAPLTQDEHAHVRDQLNRWADGQRTAIRLCEPAKA